MAAIISGLFGGSKPSESPIPAGDSDFADFAGAPNPEPASFTASTAASSVGLFAAPTAASSVPYTKWYNIHERYSLSDFKQEGVILALLFVIVLIHLYGTRTNKSRAKAWIAAHAPVLEKEFALVGFGGPRPPTVDEVEGEGLAKSLANGTLEKPEQLLKEKSPQEFITYATGRQNVAFVDVTINLLKRYNPFGIIAEYALSLFFDSMPAPAEHVQAVIYPFDGREALTIPGQIPGAHELRKDTKSSYDGFVWAVVNKDSMKQLRDDRYDLSITVTKDSPKLPVWTTVMSESAEVTDLLLTPDLIKAIEQAGDLFDHLIVTDQPIDQPLKLEETTPKKRVYLTTRLSPSNDYTNLVPIFEQFIRLPDTLVQSAHFRPEVMRKVRATREDAIRKLQKAEEEEKAEERGLERERAKKLKRDIALKGLDAKQQKKFLEKEREREIKKSQKRQTMKA